MPESRDTLEEARPSSAPWAPASSSGVELPRTSPGLDLLSIVAHEVRAHLANICMAAELVGRRVGDVQEAARVHRWLDMIQAESLRLGGLMENLSNAARLDGRSLELAAAPIDLVPLLQGAVEAVQTMSDRHMIELVVRHPVPLAMADSPKIRIAMDNLLRNAINYSPSGGTVVVEVGAEGHEVVISVSDHGVGIPADQLERVFDRFTRLESRDTATVRGYGLGLYIVKGMVERHGGRVWVESRVGEGSRFSLAVPCAEAACDRQVDAQSPVKGCQSHG